MEDRTLSLIMDAAGHGRKASSNPQHYEAVTQREETTKKEGKRKFKKEFRLWLRTTQGASHHIQYTQILDIVFLEPNMLTIVCPNSIFMITSKDIDLLELEEALHDEQVYRLQPFNANLFDPLKEGTGVITNITLQEKRQAPANHNAVNKRVKEAQKPIQTSENPS